MSLNNDIEDLPVTQNLIDELPISEGLSRICIHDSLDAPLHVMILALGPEATYPLHYHKTRSEFYWVIDGELEIKLIKKNESSTKVYLNTSKNRGFLVNAGIMHAVKNKSKNVPCRFLEIRPGPFDPSDSVMFSE